MLKHVGASLSYNKCISRMHNTDLLTAWIQDVMQHGDQRRRFINALITHEIIAFDSCSDFSLLSLNGSPHTQRQRDRETTERQRDDRETERQQRDRETERD